MGLFSGMLAVEKMLLDLCTQKLGKTFDGRSGVCEGLANSLDVIASADAAIGIYKPL
jgi:hypothetical protein